MSSRRLASEALNLRLRGLELVSSLFSGTRAAGQLRPPSKNYKALRKSTPRISVPSWTASALPWRAFWRCHAHGARTNSSVKRCGPQLLEQFIQEDGLMVVGAEYSLENGLVDFLDSPGGAV